MVKFLIIRFSSIGDIVLTTPVVRALKQQVEEAEVHYLVKPAFASILSANPYISKIHTLQDNLNETVAELKEENFDYVMDLQNNLRSLSVKRSLRRMYFTLNKLNLKKWLFVNFKVNRLPELHIVDRYMQTARLFDVSDDGGGLDYFITEAEKVSLDTLPEAYRNGYVVVVLGAKHHTKKMPVEKMLDLVSKLEMPVILIGGPEDKEQGDTILNALQSSNVFNGCGEWSINGSASVIEQSKCVIAHDTGMMHIAAAFQKKILTIWGNTLPAFGMYAYRPHPDSTNFEVEDLSCRPCSKLGKTKCPKKHFRCMTDQRTDIIAAKANGLAKS